MVMIDYLRYIDRKSFDEIRYDIENDKELSRIVKNIKNLHTGNNMIE